MNWLEEIIKENEKAFEELEKSFEKLKEALKRNGVQSNRQNNG